MKIKETKKILEALEDTISKQVFDSIEVDIAAIQIFDEFIKPLKFVIDSQQNVVEDFRKKIKELEESIQRSVRGNILVDQHSRDTDDKPKAGSGS